MKKIIRIASVIALTSASLLYVGCTKDFSADIAKTNQDVAALNQKIETLNSTVQTINGTVESLKTTKADLSKVEELDAAIKSALEKKIGELEESLKKTAGDATKAAADAAAAKTDAAAAQAAADAVAEDLEKANAKLDTVIADVKNVADSLDIVAANVKALRADVDSLQNWQGGIETAIKTLTGRVDALAARITSIVAVPSMYEEFQYFHIDSLNGPTKDTAFFSATFAVTPKAAVKNINAEDLKVNFKEGLTRAAGQNVDTTLNVTNVIADEEAGEITVFVALDPNDVSINIIQIYRKFWDGNQIVIISEDWDNKNSNVYYSLQFAGKDEADADYEENSEYVKAHKNPHCTTIGDAELVKVDGNSLTELTEKDKKLTDTLAFNDKTGNFGKLLTTDCVTVAFNISGKLLSADQFAEFVGADINVEIDSVALAPEDTVNGFKVTRDGTKLDKATFEHVGNHQTVKARGFKVNGLSGDNYDNLLCELEENHYIGAKTVAFTLPAVSEPWTYTSWDKVTRTVSIANCKEISKVIPDSTGIKAGNFTVKSNSDTTGVNIEVKDAQRITKAAKDTTYKVEFKHAAATGDSVNIVINWEYTLEARPADKTITLANVDTTAADYTKSIKLAIDKDINKLTFAAFDAAYDKVIDSAYVNKNIESAAVKLDSVVFDGKADKNFKIEGKDLVVPAYAKAGAYSVILNKTVFGIKYTYTYIINLAWKANYKLHATPYVSAGVAVVDADTTVSPYTLKTMDMAKYLQVFDADTLAKNIAANKYTVKFKVELEDSSKFANKVDTLRGSVTAPADATVSGGFLAKSTLDWSNYNGREVKVTAYLANSQDTVDTYTFTLKYNKPVTSFTAGTQTIKRVAGKDASAVLSKSFNIKGLYHGDKNLIVDTTGAWINNGKNYYECIIGYDIDHAVFKVDGVETTFNQGTDYTFDYEDAPETAVITFKGDNNNKNIEASIPVGLGYKYDYNHVEAYWDNVVIKVVNE